MTSTFNIKPPSHQIRRDAVLVDTNVVVAVAHAQDQYHEEGSAFVEVVLGGEQMILIPVSVVVEAWGLLRSRTKSVMAGLGMLAWIQSNEEIVVVSDPTEGFEQIVALADRGAVDAVDSMVFQIAREITTQCAFKPPIPIASFDAKDFATCARMTGQSAVIIDPSTNDPYELLPRSA